ncbi:hypothetical protein [Tenacibaculum caenipelagi]|uniref:LTXXQ motif family protein n=1 Tax=Tenacibaculum caenipelagi TaxID=1325435 RepID=A0A4R6TFL0_9FLAO|nr:hypothetical protein [Tenacibaculum caenipelagi]TDQ27560.1 hypothetical protein DFQ07_1411 [Tenacibaculum caenipelagi]
MKNFILTSLLFLLLTGKSFTQQQNTDKIIDQLLEKVQEKLKLDNLQIAIIKEIILKFNQEKNNLRNKDIPIDEKRIQFQEINIRQEKELSKFLTEEQVTAFKQIMKEHKSGFRKNASSSKNRNGLRKGRRR